MNLNIFLFFFFFANQKIIEDGVYNLLFEQKYLQYSNNKIILSIAFEHPNSYFSINKILNQNCYSLNIINTNYKLSYSENKELIFIQQNDKNTSLSSWEFININNFSYAIKNKINCYIKVVNFKIFCVNIPLEEATPILLNKIYEEVKLNKLDNKLIENEPIDVLIKYIDLRDPNLKRNGIHQIEKDFDNEELKYSIRSIVKNIPWVRKIFILMPNERVRYFKEYKLIKDNIVYIKDKDLLGYDSSNSNAFQFKYWDMKKFGISDNFIIMDDDCFIGKKLKKSDFFYVQNGKVVPAIITSNFKKIDKQSNNVNYNLYKLKAINSKEEQNSDAFFYSLYITYLLIINNFKKDNIIIPDFTHNAIPVNIKEIKEIYDLVINSSYKFATLNARYRKIGYVQFQTLYLAYTFIKYNRKVKHLSSILIRIDNTVLDNYNYSLICINKGPFNYSYLSYYNSKIVMEYLFPIPTKYEIIDYSFSNISFNVVHSMEKIIKINNKNIHLFKKVRDIILFLLIIILFLIKLYFIIKRCT